MGYVDHIRRHGEFLRVIEYKERDVDGFAETPSD